MLLAAAPNPTPQTPFVRPRAVAKRSFVSHDGTSLFYRHWPALQSRAGGAVILLHREHEHSGRIEHLVDELGLADFAFFAWDARGHGCSPGPRGDAPGFATLIKDLDSFVRHVERRHGTPTRGVHIIAQGASGVIAAAWAQDYSPRLASLVLAAPAFECRGLAALAPGALLSLSRSRGEAALRTYARAEDLTHDPARRVSYRSDPLIGTTTSARLLNGLQEASRRVLAGAASIEIPVQLLIAGEDRLVRRRPQLGFYNALGTRDKEFHTFDGFHHDILGELDRHKAIDKAGQFIRRHARQEPWGREAPCVTIGARTAARPSDIAASMASVRRAASRTSVRAFGRASAGLTRAMDAGLDSAAVTEYVCRNRPEGAGTLGRLLDSRFLASLPARSLRTRSAHLALAIRAAALKVSRTGLPVRIVDLAAGTGRHVMDAIQAMDARPHSALLCEADPACIAQGEQLADERRLRALLRFTHGGGPDEPLTAALAEAPTLAIAHLTDAPRRPFHAVTSLLSAVARAVPPGGCLVHTAGPHHPDWQRHEAALAERDADDLPRVGAVRSQNDLDRCIDAAGFRLHDRWVDEWGVFSVSVSVRIGAEAAMRGLVAD